MGRLRKIADGLISKMDEISDKQQAENERLGVQPHEVLTGKGSAQEMSANQMKALQEGGILAAMKQSWKDTGPGQGVKEEDDPERRRAIHAHELAARTAARQPYRAPDGPPVTITRIGTKGKTQVQEVIAHLQRSGLAARPDLVYGIYRVPDRISPNITPHSEKGRPVEWGIVHHAGAASLPPTNDPVEATFFPREGHLIARRLGEPSVLDEDVGAVYCSLAGIPAEQCFGFARLLNFREPRNQVEGNSSVAAFIEGVTIFHRPAAGAQAAKQRMTAQAPLFVGDVGLRHDTLDWRTIRDVVQPRRDRAARLPSPLPHLPQTPEELLLAYIEVVGLRPGDCYAAASTVHRTVNISAAYGIGRAPSHQLPCVDGKPRRRLHGAARVLVMYRDRPEYAQGRERWAAYQREVLEAQLDHLTGVREPLTIPPEMEKSKGVWRAIEVGAAVFNPIDWLDYKLDGETEGPKVPFGYCWPPIQ